MDYDYILYGTHSAVGANGGKMKEGKFMQALGEMTIV